MFLPLRSVVHYGATFAVASCLATWAFPAQSQPMGALREGSAPLSPGNTDRQAVHYEGIHVADSAGTSVGLEGHGGMALLLMDGRSIAHGFYGAKLAMRTGFLSFGGVLEASDYAYEEYKQAGAYAGAYLPYTNWVDIEATASLFYHRYHSRDRKFGVGGATVDVPGLMFRLGFTDRIGERILGARLGADVFAEFDLKRRSVYWEYRIENVLRSSGYATFGGVILGLQMNVGFDLHFPRSRR